MQTPPEFGRPDNLLRPTLAFIALGAGALALAWHQAHARTPARDGTPEPHHRAQIFTTAATPPPHLNLP